MKKIISLVLCLVLCVSFIPLAPNLHASATSSAQITANQTWRDSWDGNTKYLYLTVEETGYYDLTLTDHAATARTDFYLSDLDSDGSNWNNTSVLVYAYIDTHTRENIYLIKDHLYQITVQYGEVDEDFNFNIFYADFSINFTKTDYTPTSLTLGENENLFIDKNTNEWLEFKTDAAGEYLFTLNQNAYFNLFIYEKNIGNEIGSVYFGESQVSRYNLKANTEYIIITSSSENSERLVRLNVAKAEADITNIDIVQVPTIWAENFYKYGDNAYLSYSEYSNFIYKVEFSDNTYQTCSYSQLKHLGFDINGIECTGGLYSYLDEYFLMTGSHPVLIDYMNGKTSNSSIYVVSYVQWLIDIDANDISEYENMNLTYEEGSDNSGYWLLRPEETNNYEFYSSEWSKASCSFTIFDENNVVIPYADGWKLEGGKLYSLRMIYTFNDEYSEGLSFSLQPNRDHVHSYDNSCDTICDGCGAKRTITHKYINDITKATLKANGKIVKKCSVCGNVASTTAINYVKSFALTTTSYTYNGSVRKPGVIVKDSAGKVLKKDTDYTVSYASGCTNVGTYKVTVTMKGNYSGTKTLYFKINPASYSKCKFALTTTNYTYNGALKTPGVTIKYGSLTLKKNVDYTVAYSGGRKNIGTYKVTVKMKGNYTGTKTLTFKINPKIKLSATSYTYDGKTKTPTVTVTNSAGTKLSTKYYTVSYSAGRKNVGTYTATIKFKNGHSGTYKYTFKINPPKTTVSKLTAGKKSITVAISKKSSQVTGYQVQYSTSKSFSKPVTKTISSYKTTKYTLKSLSAKKTYYVRVRTYKKVGSTTYYSGWSTYKYVKTK